MKHRNVLLRVRVCLRGLCDNEKNAIFLSGYQDEESPGRRLQELASGDMLEFPDGTTALVKCRVERFHLSAHSDQTQLVSFIKTLNPKVLSLVHGEGEAGVCGRCCFLLIVVVIGSW